MGDVFEIIPGCEEQTRVIRSNEPTPLIEEQILILEEEPTPLVQGQVFIQEGKTIIVEESLEDEEEADLLGLSSCHQPVLVKAQHENIPSGNPDDLDSFFAGGVQSTST